MISASILIHLHISKTSTNDTINLSFFIREKLRVIFFIACKYGEKTRDKKGAGIIILRFMVLMYYYKVVYFFLFRILRPLYNIFVCGRGTRGFGQRRFFFQLVYVVAKLYRKETRKTYHRIRKNLYLYCGNCTNTTIIHFNSFVYTSVARAVLRLRCSRINAIIIVNVVKLPSIIGLYRSSTRSLCEGVN